MQTTSDLFQRFKNGLELPSLLTGGMHTTTGATVDLFPPADFIERVLSRAARSPQLYLALCHPTRPLPLGRIFEQIAHAALLYAYPDRTISANVQLPAKITEGELDFVISSFSETIHLEVAIKFFLLIPPQNHATTLANFFGPQLKDRLDLKLEKLLGRQLIHPIPQHLVQTPAAPRRALWLPGMLFYPAKHFLEENFPHFQSLRINPGHRKGWWAHVRNLKSTFSDNGARFLPLARPQWLDSSEHLHADDLQTALLNAHDFEALHEPTFVLRFAKDGTPADRGFIVPNDWAATIQV